MAVPLTDVERVRLLTAATTTDASDVQITAFLEDEGAVKLAAAQLLELMASRLEYVSSDDVTVDGTRRAGVLLKWAAGLREQHYGEDEGGSFQVVPGPPAWQVF